MKHARVYSDVANDQPTLKQHQSYSLANLDPALHGDLLTISVPTYQQEGPLLNHEEARRMREQLGITTLEFEHGMNLMLNYFETLSLARLLLARRITEDRNTTA